MEGRLGRGTSPFPLMPFRYPLALLALLLAPAALAQDLSITATAEDSGGDPGGRVTLDYTVTLTGAEEIEDIGVGFYFSTDQTLSDNDAFSEREEVDAESDEAESDNEQIDIPSSLASGDYFILVVIDDLDQVSETDETNNTAAIPFEVGGGSTGGGGAADLSITQASISPEAATAGAEAEVSYTLANTGSEQAGETQVAFYVSTNATLSSNDTFVTRNDADEADAGDSGDEDEDITVPAGLASGDYFLLVVADDRNAVTESNESNNVFAVPFTVTGGDTGGGGDADLAVSGVSVSPASAGAGDEIEVSYTLANRGSEDAAESQIAFYVSRDASLSSDDVLVSREDGDEVDAGDSESSDEDLTVPASLASGDYFVLVVADDRNAVTESNERNNVGAAAFTVTGSTGGGDGTADLRVTNAAVTPGGGEAGESVQVSYTLANEGTGQAAESSLAFYLSTDRDLGSSDTLIEADDVDEQDANSSGDEDEDITVPAGVAPGDYFLLIVADDGNEVTERRENNNVFAVPFTVESSVSTTPEAVSGVALGAPAPNPAAGAIRVAFETTEPGAVHLAVYDARGREVAVLARGPLGAGAHGATWETGAAAPGVYVVRLRAGGEVVTRSVVVSR